MKEKCSGMPGQSRNMHRIWGCKKCTPLSIEVSGAKRGQCSFCNRNAPLDEHGMIVGHRGDTLYGGETREKEFKKCAEGNYPPREVILALIQIAKERYTDAEPEITEASSNVSQSPDMLISRLRSILDIATGD